jgi:type III pantothenate kinase
MPELLVDMGNTRLKLGWLADGLEVLGAVEQARDIVGLLPGQPQRIWVSSVAEGYRTVSLLDELARLDGELVQVEVARFHRHLPTRYDMRQLGVDRWLAALAGYARARGSCVVVDAGTATTIDLVDAEGTHVGGYILPGEGLTVQAIQDATAIDISGADVACTDALPRNTAQAIHCGSLSAQVALVERARISLGADCTLFVCGGNMQRLTPLLAGGYQPVRQLVLEGLAWLARREA